MHVAGYLEFSSLVLVVLCAVIGSMNIRRKWQLMVARRKEIKRLMDLAAEETARVERGYTNSKDKEEYYCNINLQILLHLNFFT